MKTNILCVGLCMLFFSACCQRSDKAKQDVLAGDILVAEKQIGEQVNRIERSGKLLMPYSFDDSVKYVPVDDWTSGFFSGTMWYMYDLTKNEKWKKWGIKYTENLGSVKHLTWHHDIGFIIMSSYGNAYKTTQNPAYRAVIIEAAKSLSTRFRPKAGVLQSWDENHGWQGTKGWMCPVIIDNMMNLELLFEASRLSGDSTFRNIAISHANATMSNHFRKNYSCYHVVDYDKIRGGIRSRVTAQGYSDESSWARGQAWALYGFTMCYRETKDKRYLDLAEDIYKFIFNNKNMPDDLVPYWDFDAPNIPNEPRDASAAAIMASALYELSTFGKSGYKETADRIVASLSSDAYRAIVGTNGNFLLMHSVGSIPHKSCVDVPLNYADYYFLESLTRKKKLEQKLKS